MERSLTTTTAKVLVIEDEESLRERILKALRFEGYEAVTAEDGSAGLQLALEQRPDVVVTDILMPRISGFDVVSLLRSNPETRLTPIIVLTAVEDRSSHRYVMQLGADDYITKPFETDELVGALEAQLRKREWLKEASASVKKDEQVLAFHHWKFDPERRKLVSTSGENHSLSVSEARLLQVLLDNANQVISRYQLAEQMSRHDYSPLDRSVDVLIGRLRRKIEPDPKNPKILETIRSAGYVLNTKPQ